MNIKQIINDERSQVENDTFDHDKYYYNGSRCNHGHISKRCKKYKKCWACLRISTRRRYYANRKDPKFIEKQKEYHRRSYKKRQNDPEFKKRMCENQKKYKERIRETDPKRYERLKKYHREYMREYRKL